MIDPFNISSKLQQQRRRQLVRQRRTVVGAGNQLQTDGKSVVNFCSNDYLGLSNHPRLQAAVSAAMKTYGFGSGASHLVSGHSKIHHELEEKLAAWVKRPRALLFSTGYMANLGVISALAQRGDSIIQDKLNHASLLEGALLSQARLLRYKHNDTESLQRQLAVAEGCKLVVTDSVFSMDGDIAPLPAIARCCQQQGAWLMIDDAHGLGVLGAGHGVLEELNLSLEQVPVYMATLGKALGSFGAFVAGSDELIEFLIQFARSYIYTTAIPPAVAAATIASLDVLAAEPERVVLLQQRIHQFRQGAQQLELPLLDSSTAIQPLVVGDSARALSISDYLFEQGFLVTAIRPPTVPVGTARLRVTLNANHSAKQVAGLLQRLGDAFTEVAQ